MQSPLNFSRLSRPTLIQMLKLEKRAAITCGVILLVGFLFMMGLAALSVAGNQGTIYDASVTYGVMGGFAIFFVVSSLAILIGGWYGKYRDLGIRNFAEDNGFRCMALTDLNAWHGAIFTQGSGNSKLWPLIEGTHTNQHFWLGNYNQPGSKVSNTQEETWGVIRIELPRNLPNVLLDSKANDILGRFSNLPTGYAGYQKYELEGGFNDYFTVYAPRGYERDMLYFLTPELMAAFIDYGANFDIEIIDDYLYLYSSMPFGFTPETLQPLFDIIETLGFETTDNTGRYADDHAISASVTAPTEPTPSAAAPLSVAASTPAEKGTVLPQGRRLKTRWTIAQILFILLFVWMFGVYIVNTFFNH